VAVLSRRALLRGLLPLGALAASGVDPVGSAPVGAGGDDVPLPEIPVGGPIRPPGAGDEGTFRARCVSCGVCVSVCHAMGYDALAPAGLARWRDFGTPYVKDMRDFPCGLCMACPPRCPTGALAAVDKSRVTMGQALIDISLCLGWNGDVCLSCSKACPLGAQVFAFDNGAWGNQPSIGEACVGCGLCVRYCPLGGSAMKVVTRAQYALAKSRYRGEQQRVIGMTSEERYQVVYDTNLPRIIARERISERIYR
jgi:ferredoxin